MATFFKLNIGETKNAFIIKTDMYLLYLDMWPSTEITTVNKNDTIHAMSLHGFILPCVGLGDKLPKFELEPSHFLAMSASTSVLLSLKL